MTQTSTQRRVLYHLFFVVAALLLIGLLVVIAMSPVPMRGAKVFGGIANKIKGHPGATAYWVSAAGASLWLGIGILVAIQEWRIRQRPAP